MYSNNQTKFCACKNYTDVFVFKFICIVLMLPQASAVGQISDIISLHRLKLGLALRLLACTEERESVEEFAEVDLAVGALLDEAVDVHLQLQVLALHQVHALLGRVCSQRAARQRA